MSMLAGEDRVRLLGPSEPSGDLHRCPTVAFVPLAREPEAMAASLAEHGIMAGAGDFYANRVLAGLDVAPERGVVRVSFVHYTSSFDVEKLLAVLDGELG